MLSMSAEAGRKERDGWARRTALMATCRSRYNPNFLWGRLRRGCHMARVIQLPGELNHPAGICHWHLSTIGRVLAAAAFAPLRDDQLVCSFTSEAANYSMSLLEGDCDCPTRRFTGQTRSSLFSFSHPHRCPEKGPLDTLAVKCSATHSSIG